MTDLSVLDAIFGGPNPKSEPAKAPARVPAPIEPDARKEPAAPRMDLEDLAKLARVNASIREMIAAAPGGPPGLPETATPDDDMPEPPGWLEARLERAAIFEAEGGLSPEQAKTEAARMHPEPEPHAGADDGETWHGFTRAALLDLADPNERADLEANPDALVAFAFALRLDVTRSSGHRPEHYTREAVCDFCGPVWLFPDDAIHVRGCPWCSTTAEGRPIPRSRVRCSECLHWRADPINAGGGLGSCEIEAPTSKVPGSLWPRGETFCGAWRPKSEEESTT